MPAAVKSRLPIAAGAARAGFFGTMRKVFRARPAGESGQAVVESAIILPLYVFLVLGILQLSLMHQARLMAKYAAYKAVRTGSIHNANVQKMEMAALAVFLPMASEPKSGAEKIMPVNGAGDYGSKWGSLKTNQMSDVGLKYAEVTTCGPLKGDVTATDGEVDFDDPKLAAGDSGWKESERTKLRVQVTFNYRMPIPFANMVIHRATRNQELPYVLRLVNTPGGASYAPLAARIDNYASIANSQKIYVLPIRATYTMRMQSNLYIDNLPDQNECLFTFSY